MKLELKHLAIYLPYNLKANSQHPGNVIWNGQILGIDFIKGVHVGDANQGYFTSITFIKPILRPLSDLNTFKYKPKYGNRLYAIKEIMPFECFEKN